MTAKLHSAPDVASLLGVELDTLYRYARSGRLRGVKIGKFWRFTDADLEAFIQSRRYVAPDTDAPVLLPDALRTVADGSNRGGVVCGTSRLSYSEIDLLSDRLAQALLESGVTTGDRVVTILPNSVEFVIACFGTWKARAVLVPEDVGVRLGSLRHIVSDVRPAAFIVDRSVAERLDDTPDIVRRAKVVFVKDRTFSSTGVEGILVESLDAVLESDVEFAGHPGGRASSDEIVSVNYTSGSTGRPKGVMHTHESWLAGACFTRDYVGLSPSDQIVVPLPLHHGLAFRQILAYVLADATLIIAADIYQALKVLRDKRPTALVLVPAATNIAIDHFPSVLTEADHHLRYVELGSAAMAPERLARLKELLPTTPIHFAYGLTEARVGYLAAGPGGLLNRISHVTPGLEVTVVDEIGGEVPKGVTGEIHLRGDGLMRGYWGDPEEKLETWRRQGFHTGDLGRLAENHEVELLGRLDDMLKVGGRKVNPVEVEMAIDRHPHVVESAVVGMPDPSGIFEHELHAFVVTARDVQLRQSELLAHCRRFLESYKMPSRIHFRSSLPKSAVGKVSKHVLRAESPTLTNVN